MTDAQEDEDRDCEALERAVAALDSNDGVTPADLDRVRTLSLYEMERHQVADDDSLAALCLAVGLNGHQSWRLVMPDETAEVRVTTTRPRRHRLGRRSSPIPLDDVVIERLNAAGLAWLPLLGQRVLRAPDRPWLVVVREAFERGMAHAMLATAWNAARPRHARIVAEALRFNERIFAECPTQSTLAGYAGWRQLDLVTWLLHDHHHSWRHLSWWAACRWSSLVTFCGPESRSAGLRLLGVGAEEEVTGELLADGVELLDLDDTAAPRGTDERA